MSDQLKPVQPELPFDLPANTPVGLPGASEPTLPPSIYEQLYARARQLPWDRWRLQARKLSKKAALHGARLGKLALVRGTPYMVRLGQSTARSSLFQSTAHTVASLVHAVGLPAVVLRTSIQLTIIYRSGLNIDEVVYYRFDDPVGYVVYEAPASLSTALAIAYVPTLVLLVLAVICVWPALTPRSVLHLPFSMLTIVQVWLGLSFAAHALPNHEEAAPLAEQAHAGLEKADPLGLIAYLPTFGLAFLTRFGTLLPAAVASAAVIFFASRIFQ